MRRALLLGLLAATALSTPAPAAPAIPLVAAAAGYATAAAVGAGILGSLAGFVVSTAISQIGGRLFAKKPKAQNFQQDAGGRITAVRSSVESHKVIYGQTRVSGPIAFVTTTDYAPNMAGENKVNKLLHMLIPLAGHEVEEIGDVYFNDQVLVLNADGFVTNAPYAIGTQYYARVRKHLGTADQQADPVMGLECPGWTDAHRLRGIAYVYVRMEYNQDVFPLGIPNVSAVVKGKKVYDPRTTLTAWTDNAALCIRDYLTADYGFNCDDAEVNDDYFVAAANACDEDVALAGGGTQNRYTCNGVVDTAVAPLDNLNELTSSLAGSVTYVQGKFRCHAGAYDAPSGAITTDMLAGPVKIRTRTPRKELFNAVKGTYVDPDRNWQPTDFPFVTNATYEAQDGGERIYKDVDLPFTNSPAGAQRIGKLLLEKARQGITVEMQLHHDAVKYAVFDTVTVTNAQVGWDAKVFRIMKWSSTGTGPVSVVLQEESSASYDWASTEATTVDFAPDSNLPSATTVQPPGTPLVTETLYATTDGSGVKAKATVTWAASADAFLRDYQLEYKLTSATEYTVVPRIASTTHEVLDIAPGTYTFRVKAVNNLGVSSAYASTPAEMYGLTAAPGQVQNFSLNAIGGAAHLSWSQSADLDVVNGGSVRIRYTPATTGASWNSAVDVGAALPGSSTQATLPLMDGTYLAKFIDSVGNASETAASITSTITSLLELNVVETVTEHPAFAGAKSGVVYDPELGGIKLDSATNWDSYPGNVDTWPYIDGLGGIASSGTYTFDGEIDLGAVYPCRVTAAIEAFGYDTGDTIDQRYTNIDTWTSFDGGGTHDFTNSYWTNSPSNVTVTADEALAPDGTMTADFVRENTANDEHHIFGNEETLSILRETVTTIELYVKPVGTRNFRISVNWLGDLVEAEFDLAGGTVEDTSAAGLTELDEAGITAAGNGFYRVWVTSHSTTVDGGDLIDCKYSLLDGSFADTYAGDGNSGVYLWGYKAYRGAVKAESAIDDVNAAFDVRTTDDDPSGTPTWSDWRPFFVGDYTARAFQFRLRLTGAGNTHNLLVTALSATVDMPDRVESQRNLSSGAGTYSVTFPAAFKATPTVVITPKNMATGDYYEVSGEDATGFDVVFRNAAAAAVSRNFDYHAKGYGRVIT